MGIVDPVFRHVNGNQVARNLLDLESNLVSFLVGAELGIDLRNAQTRNRFSVQGENLVAPLESGVSRRRTLVNINELKMHRVAVLIHDVDHPEAENKGLAGKHHFGLDTCLPVAESAIVCFRLPAQFFQHGIERAVILQYEFSVL